MYIYIYKGYMCGHIDIVFCCIAVFIDIYHEI